MTRTELLHLLIAQARINGFQFRRWYVGWLGLPWASSQESVQLLSEGRRYYSLLFSREFAENFWKSGGEMTLQMPSQTFQRRMANGSVGTVVRKGFTRRRTRPDAWRYHLQQMSVAEEPLRYIRRFLRVAEDLEPEPDSPLPDQGSLAGDPRFVVDEEDLLTD